MTERPSGRSLAGEQTGPPMRSMGVRTSGLPCRANHDCEVVFNVSPSDSMDALREAASRRNLHELEAYGYSLALTTTLGPSTFFQGPRAGRRRRMRRVVELNV